MEFRIRSGSVAFVLFCTFLLSSCNLQTIRSLNNGSSVSEPVTAAPTSRPTNAPQAPPAPQQTRTFVYVSSPFNFPGSQGITTYSLNRTTGTLTEVPGSFAATDLGSQPEDLVATPDGKFLYLADAGQRIISFS